MEPIKNRYDFVYIFDVLDGNPNGDPDAGNLPRIDAETGMGLVTDVCLKRKIRNYVQLAKKQVPGFNIFIQEKAILNNLIDEAHADKFVASKKKEEKEGAARQWMIDHYYDVRTFGAVMSTGKKAGQVRGPIQLTFARSVDPIVSQEHTITRVAVTKSADSKKQDGANQAMGTKATVPYGLYVAHGFISANLAGQTGFTQEDLDLFWEALKNMFDNDRSAARGLMSPQRLIVFKHDSELGNAPAHKLFDLVHINKKTGAPARSITDYDITVDKDAIPEKVELIEMI